MGWVGSRKMFCNEIRLWQSARTLSDGGMFPGGGKGEGGGGAGWGLFTFSPGHCGPGGVKLAPGVANITNPETEAQLDIVCCCAL